MISLEWLLAILLLGQLFLYAARVPMHRALRSMGRIVGGGLRLAARWFRRVATDLHDRSEELVLESGRETTEHKIDREFRRIECTFAKDLAHFPDLRRRLDDLVASLENDHQECGTTPPPSPEWGEVVRAVANMPQTGDKMLQRVFEEMHKAAVEGEKRAFQEYQTVTAKRHRILSAMLPRWKDVRGLLREVGDGCARALESTTRIDGYMTRYEQILREERGARRILTWSAINTFVISGIVIAVALGGAFINFQLIALPMSELVPAGSRLMGVPVPSIAALVLVLMEVAAGIFVLEMLGITGLFSQLGHLAANKRRLILIVALFGLLMLASIESSLAILREQIVEAESALKQSLSGGDLAVGRPVGSVIPLVGQAVLGFILPWILAMVAIPLEMLIHTAGPVILMVLSLAFGVVGYLTRLCSHVALHLASIASAMYDVVIVIPLQIERIVKHRHPVPVTGDARALRNPTEETGDHEVLS